MRGLRVFWRTCFDLSCTNARNQRDAAVLDRRKGKGHPPEVVFAIG